MFYPLSPFFGGFENGQKMGFFDGYMVLLGIPLYPEKKMLDIQI